MSAAHASVCACLLARETGSKGYHDEVFEEGPYPVALELLRKATIIEAVRAGATALWSLDAQLLRYQGKRSDFVNLSAVPCRSRHNSEQGVTIYLCSNLNVLEVIPHIEKGQTCR